jgi:hypothetical protein
VGQAAQGSHPVPPQRVAVQVKVRQAGQRQQSMHVREEVGGQVQCGQRLQGLQVLNGGQLCPTMGTNSVRGCNIKLNTKQPVCAVRKQGRC